MYMNLSRFFPLPSLFVTKEETGGSKYFSFHLFPHLNAIFQPTISKSFSKSAIKLLQEYDWTGNIRELRNVVERLIILGGNEISEQDVKLFASK